MKRRIWNHLPSWIRNFELFKCIHFSIKPVSIEVRKKLGVVKFRAREVNTAKNGTQHLPSGHFKSMFFFSQIGRNKAWITLTVVTNLIIYCYIKFNAIVGFHMTSLKFKLKTIDPTEILLSRCIRAAEN